MINYTKIIKSGNQGRLTTNDIEVLFFYESREGKEVTLNLDEVCEALDKLEIKWPEVEE